ncbi:MAG: DNA-packaging protein [Clostridia bacterium]|jgi:hypothetical protein|nr:DNA-packaging protein [Clostridia bacterium]
MNSVGRPPKYKSAEEIQEKIDKYFKECDGQILLDEDEKPVFDKKGNPIYKVLPRPPTMTGLALALGFNTRTSLFNYKAKKEFVNTITRAKSRIEEYTEQRLFDKDGVQGAKFSLVNNFDSWSDKSDVNVTSGQGFELTVKGFAGDFDES